MLDELRGISRETVLLADYWDGLATGEAPGTLDPTLAETIHTLDLLARDERAEGPDPEFVRHLLADLVSAVPRVPHSPSSLGMAPNASSNGRSRPRPFRPDTPERDSRRKQFTSPLAAAALLLFFLGSSVIAFGPWHASRQEPAPAVTSLPVIGPVEFLAEIKSTPQFILFDPSFVNVDPWGNLWITDDRYSRFLIFASDGTFLEAWGAHGHGEGEFSFSTGGHTYGDGDMAWDSAGNLYVVDTGNLRVQKFDATRRFVRSWGGQGTANGQFEEPLGIAIGGDDRIYVTDGARDDVQLFDLDGTFLGKFGGFGVAEGQFLGVFGGIAVAPDGTVLVADSEGHRLLRFDRDGAFLGTWGAFGGGNGQFASPQSIAADTVGRVYVTDNFNHRVQVFTADGEFLSSWGSEGTDIGQFVFPAGISIDRMGGIYVADTGNQRIQKFRLLPPMWPGSVMSIGVPPAMAGDGPP